MPTVTSLAGAAKGYRTAGRVPFVVDNYIDFAAAATANGTALVAGDIIEALNIDKGWVVLDAGIEVVTATTQGGASDVTVDLGVTGGDIDKWVDGFDLDGASAGDYAASPATGSNGAMTFTADDTIDVEIQTATTAPTAGKIRVYAVVVDANAIGEADEVARDFA